MTIRTAGMFLLCIGAALSAGFWGATATIEAIPTWYASINKPTWTPPNWVFMPVWTTLYILMGAAAALVWRTGKQGVWKPVLLFFVHLLVNTYWSISFFGNQDPQTALMVIAVLWLMIVAMMMWFYRYTHIAAYLLVPYLLWISYASSLNLGVVLLNP